MRRDRAKGPEAAPASELYARALGTAWEHVAPRVRSAHVARRHVGSMSVHGGRGFLAALLAALLRLPESIGREVVTLRIEQAQYGEAWMRTIGRQRLITTQRLIGDRTIEERIGPLAFQLRLTVANGAINYRTRRCSLALFALRLPLPRILSPRISAIEAPSGPGATAVFVKVYFPYGGLLLSYSGELEVSP